MCMDRRKSKDRCDECPNKFDLWPNNVLPVTVAYRAGWDRTSDGTLICLNRSDLIALLKVAECDDIFDALDRIDICQAEMLRIYNERRTS